jgi:hypothetical protein
MKGLQFLVTLNHVKPQVWRQIILPSELDFYDLHSVIQTAMGWTDSHLFAFYLEDTKSNKTIQLVGDEESVQEHFARAKVYMKSPPEKGTYEEGMYQRFIRTQLLLARDVKLDAYDEKNLELRYTYDFGDGWDHHVKLKKVLEDYEFDYPILLDGKGDCPPEDVGGPPGYDEFKRVMKDKNDPEHSHMKAWAKSQGFKKFKIDSINEDLQDEWC